MHPPPSPNGTHKSMSIPNDGDNPNPSKAPPVMKLLAISNTPGATRLMKKPLLKPDTAEHNTTEVASIPAISTAQPSSTRIPGQATPSTVSGNPRLT